MRGAAADEGLLPDDRNEPATAGGRELNDARNAGEERVVAPPTHAGSGMDPRATLANQDGTGRHVLTREALHPKPFGLGVTTIARGGSALLVSHSGS